MTPTLTQMHGTAVLVRGPDAPPLGGEPELLDLIGEAWSHQAELVAIPVAQLPPEFFRLSSGLAGTVSQKFVNYHVRLAVVGDISGQLATSSALRAFVAESNRGRQLWFVADLAALGTRLEAGPGRRTGSPSG